MGWRWQPQRGGGAQRDGGCSLAAAVWRQHGGGGSVLAALSAIAVAALRRRGGGGSLAASVAEQWRRIARQRRQLYNLYLKHEKKIAVDLSYMAQLRMAWLGMLARDVCLLWLM